MRAVIFASLLSACFLDRAPDPYTVDTYWVELGTTHCQTMVDCCTTAEYNDWWTTSDGKTLDCKLAHEAPGNSQILRDGIKRGTIVFDEARAHACVEALAQLACPAFEQAYRFRETYCEPPLVGTLADGTQCNADEECTSRFCNLGTGACASELPENASCVENVDRCVAPFRCNNPGDGTFTCNLGLPAGATCSQDDNCANGWCKDSPLGSTCRDACNGV